MKKILFSLTLTLVACTVFARKPNYDESKVGSYQLEDPLTFANGQKLKSSAEWPARRQEILNIFQKEMYGKMPPEPEYMNYEVIEQGTTLAGFATRKQIRMWFKPDKTGPQITWLLLTPRYAKTPSPIILFLNYGGNHELLKDKEIIVSDAWLRPSASSGRKENKPVERNRGIMTDISRDSIFPASMILARGYAVMSACYGEISPDPDSPKDQDAFAYTKIFSLWGPRDPNRTDNTTSLAAWGWALMRGLDLAEKLPELDAKRSVVTGCSRLGKAALIAGAFDDRFAVVAPNQTGGGGAPLAKRNFGENVSTEMRMFTHWYCRAYGKYVDNEQTMKFDQHLLLAAVAPRGLLVQGFGSPWFDTKGEYLSCKAASPAWTFLGKPGLPDHPFPDELDTSCIGPYLGYVRRQNNHGISAYDWTWIMNFADCIFKQ